MLLVIETAFDALSVALLDDSRIAAEHHAIVGRGHAETLMTAVAAVVGTNGASITGVLVDIGPGSFTGLRVGIAAARALALAWEVPIAGIGSLTLIAAAAFAADPALDRVAAVANAGRGQVYWQIVERRGGAVGEVIATPTARAMLPAEIAVTGAGAALIDGHPRLLAKPPRAADARHVPPAWRGLPPLPVYLRAPDAVAA